MKFHFFSSHNFEYTFENESDSSIIFDVHTRQTNSPPHMLYMDETDIWEAQVFLSEPLFVYAHVCFFLELKVCVYMRAMAWMVHVQWLGDPLPPFHVFLASSALFPFLITAELSLESV